MDSPYHTSAPDIDSVKDCGSIYGLFVGIALALMITRLGPGLIR
jgi:tetrahydromethanopterin S-methyltransferase subunit G